MDKVTEFSRRHSIPTAVLDDVVLKVSQVKQGHIIGDHVYLHCLDICEDDWTGCTMETKRLFEEQGLIQAKKHQYYNEIDMEEYSEEQKSNTHLFYLDEDCGEDLFRDTVAPIFELLESFVDTTTPYVGKKGERRKLLALILHSLGP